MAPISNNRLAVVDFVLKEWLTVTAGIGLVLTSLCTKRLPAYSIRQLQILFILLVLFIAANGLQQSGLLEKIARALEKGRALPLKLVLTTFFLSMLLTNDIALVVMVPLTLALGVDRKDILVILEALAANAGSALTPFGNPQNLFIYWYYGISATQFVTTIMPFSLVSLLLLVLFSCAICKKGKTAATLPLSRTVRSKACFYAAFLALVILIVLHILPVAMGLPVILFALLFDRKALRIDYALLLSFLFFFGIADNMTAMLSAEISHSRHIFLFSALVSQIMSNVPATLLFARFTSNWQALLWGANTGGFGSLFGSLANVIAYKIYVTHASTDKPTNFFIKFLVLGYAAFFVSTGLYFILYRPGW